MHSVSCDSRIARCSLVISISFTYFPFSKQQAINSWMPQAETKFANMSKIAADPRSAKIQIEELKVCSVLRSALSYLVTLLNVYFNFNHWV